MEMPTKEQILEAANDCPQAKAVLQKLWPSIFKEKEKYQPRIGDMVEYVGSETPMMQNHYGVVYGIPDKVYGIPDSVRVHVFWENFPHKNFSDQGIGGHLFEPFAYNLRLREYLL